MKTSILINQLRDMRNINKRLMSFFKSILIIGVWILIWQSAYIYVGKDILIPSPFRTLKALGEMTAEKNFYINVLITLYRVGVGIVISFVMGLITAILAYFIPVLREFLKPLIIILKSTPVMAVIILALIWFKSSNVPIFVCFLMCYPIVYTNIFIGLISVDKQLIEMAKVYKVSKKYILKDIYIPHINSYIKSALSLIIGLSWKVVVAAEVLSVPKYSMGYNLFTAKVYLETDQLFAWIIIIILLSSLCEKIVVQLLFKKGNIHCDRDTGTI